MVEEGQTVSIYDEVDDTGDNLDELVPQGEDSKPSEQETELARLKRFEQDVKSERLFADIQKRYPGADQATIATLIKSGASSEDVELTAQRLHESYAKGAGQVARMSKAVAWEVHNQAKIQAEEEVRTRWGGAPGELGGGGGIAEGLGGYAGSDGIQQTFSAKNPYASGKPQIQRSRPIRARDMKQER